MKNEALRDLAQVPAPSLGKTKGEPLMSDDEFDEYMKE